MKDNLLKVKNLTKIYYTNTTFLDKILEREKNGIKALDNVSFSLKIHTILGIIGESGCGKTTLGKVIIRLEEPQSGEIYYKNSNINLLKLTTKELFKYRKKIQMIFQNPIGALNPRLTIYEILKEPLKTHGIKCNYKEKIGYLLNLVGLSEEFMHRYPHEMSGGQKQRVNIARAISIEPELIIADEPVSSLDVSSQINILKLLKKLQEDFDLSYIFITHDLGTAKFLCDEIIVMYMGEIVEYAPKSLFFKKTLHPYSRLLLESVPRLKNNKKEVIKDLYRKKETKGCKFAPRCKYAKKKCFEEKPELIGNAHKVRCFLYY